MLPIKTSINNNESRSNRRSYSIPSLKDIEDRFFDLEVNIYINIDYRGYLREINSTAPFTGILSIKKIINLLNKDINVIITNDVDLVKLRNFIIFYNEYLVPNPDLNKFGYTTAPIAFDRIEAQFMHRFNTRNDQSEIDNPFINNLISEFTNSFDETDPNDAFEEYIKKKREEEQKISLRSAKIGGINNEVKLKEPIVTMHSRFCSNMRLQIDLENYEYCYEDCVYL